MAALSVQRVVLLAAHLASRSLINPLEHLADLFPKVLSKEVIYGILLEFLPESTNPQDYIPLLIKLHNSIPLDSGSIDEYDLKYVSSLSDRRVAKKIAGINRKVALDDFVRLHCRNIDAETGLIQYSAAISDIPIVSKSVQEWNRGIVRVVEKLVNRYGVDISVAEFETLHVDDALAVLFQVEDNTAELMKSLIYPYLHFKGDGWDKLQNSIILLSIKHLVQLSYWKPPESFSSRFVEMVLTAIYANNTTEFRRISEIQTQLISCLKLEEEDILCQAIPPDYTDVTMPSAPSLHLLNMLLTSAQLFADQNSPTTLKQLLQLRLSTHEDQSFALIRLIRGLGNRKNWRELREKVTWLRTSSGVLGKLEKNHCEKQILASMLSSNRLKEAQDIYILSPNPPLPLEDVQLSVDSAFLEHFDNATTMKNTASAEKIVSLLETPNTAYHNRLLSAAQKLSSFKLQQNDIALLPIQVRLTTDPLHLISRILQQNTWAYTQMSVLQSIMADLDPHNSHDETILEMTTEAALSSGDFYTAYEMSKQLPKTSWKSYYQIGKYPGPARLRLEVLAKALQTCPPEILSEILNRFNALEQQISESQVPEEVGLLNTSFPLSDNAIKEMTLSQTIKPPRVDPKLLLQGGKGIKDAVASKFTSGIGWVLGADVE